MPKTTRSQAQAMWKRSTEALDCALTGLDQWQLKAIKALPSDLRPKKTDWPATKEAANIFIKTALKAMGDRVVSKRQDAALCKAIVMLYRTGAYSTPTEVRAAENKKASS